MLDLKIYDEDQYDLVPVPLPGRLMIFAGPDGLMCRRNDGTIANYPESAGGGSTDPAPGTLTNPFNSAHFTLGISSESCEVPQTGISLSYIEGVGFVYTYSSGGTFDLLTGEPVLPPVPAPT